MIHKTTRSILSVLLAALLLVTSTPLTPAFAGEGAVSPQSESGEGGELEPAADGVYQISTAEDLREFAKLVNGGKTDADAVLTDDINLNPDMEISEDGTVTGNLDPWTPIGNSESTAYTGTFDGNGKTIENLYINNTTSDEDQGLFGNVSSGGKIEKLVVSGSVTDTSSNSNDVGGIVGQNFGGTVTGCAFSGTVTSSGISGGVVGENYGSVTNCYNTGSVNVTGDNGRVGGVVGYNSGSVTNCYNTGSVSGPDSGSGNSVGGVVGYNYIGGNVENCYNTGSVNVTGDNGRVGGVVGWNISGGTVKNCYNTGSVSGPDSGTVNRVGGVVGYNSGIGNVKNCYNTGKVSGPDSGSGNSVGGVVGDNRGSVENCYNTGSVSGSGNSVGGVVGYSSGGSGGNVTGCYNTGTVSGGEDVGGVVGYNDVGGSVTNSYNTGAVSGGEDVGGVVGENSGFSTVENCYNTGEVSGNSSVGGVVGYNNGLVKNCYNTGTVSGPDSGSGNSVGGVVGYNNDGTVENCYFLKQNGVPAQGIGSGSGSATPLSAKAFENQKSFNSWTEFTNTWEIEPIFGRPTLKANAEIGGTANNPYKIFTAAQLENFRDLVNGEDGQTADPDAHAKLMNDIDLSSVCSAGKDSWTPIGSISKPYSGTFDGNGHKIENLYINTTDSGADNQGLFGYVGGFVGSEGTVQNLTVEGSVSSTVANSNVGGVVGYNNGGTVTGCIFSGSGSVSVTGGNSVGGVVGLNHGSVENCYNTGKVSGNRYVGGVVGDNRGTVENCYNTGTVSDGGISGGVVGCNQGGSVQNCYNTGAVSGSEFVGGVVGYNLIRSTVENCYNIGAVSGNGSDVGGVVGYNDSNGNVTGCYFLKTADVNENLSGIGEGSGSATEKDDTAFHSGEVAYLLGEAWGQSALGTKDSLPTLVALDKDAKPVYKVAFISDNTEIEAKYANSGMTVGSPTTNPTKEGYTFAGWFTKSSGGSQWNFSTAVTENMTLYAKWTEITPDPDPDPTPTPTPDPEPSGPSTGDSTGWDDILDELENTAKGDQITIDMGDETKVPAEIFESLAGKDVEISFDLGDVQWTVNGADIPTDTDFTDLDLGVNLDTSGIPVNVINTITGERDSVQMTLAHDGEFGFTMTLTAPLGKENAGYWANLYHYKVNGGEADREDPLGDDEDAEALNFEAAVKIDETGSVTIPFSHASQYAIVIDDHSHATVDVSDLFIDVAPNAWYKDAVQYAYDHGLMTGTSANEFAPEATTTRAMIVSILARLENVTTAEAAGFADVDDNDWYATAVNWAASVGVVNGYEDNTFRPNTAITREQLAAILMNYAAYKGYDVSARADLSHYSDADSISSWANDVLLWAVAEGLLTGVTDDTIAPQAHATRAQVAAILQRFLSE